MNTAQKLEQILKKRGLYRRTVDARSGVAYGTVQHILNGTEPGVRNAIKICKFLNVAVE